MESKATFKHVRIGPRKARRVVDMVRGKGVEQALDLLRFDKHAIAKDVGKLIKSAVSNAMQKGGVRPDTLFVKTIMVNQAAIMKRFMPRAKGSASAIQKKLSHITIVLGERL